MDGSNEKRMGERYSSYRNYTWCKYSKLCICDSFNACIWCLPESASGNGTYNTETLYTSCSCDVGISDFTDFKTCTVKLQRSNESGLCGNGKGERS